MLSPGEDQELDRWHEDNILRMCVLQVRGTRSEGPSAHRSSTRPMVTLTHQQTNPACLASSWIKSFVALGPLESSDYRMMVHSFSKVQREVFVCFFVCFHK